MESHLSLFFGSNLTCLIVLKCLSQMNPGLPGFLYCWVSPRALCWALFSSSYILLTFPFSFQNSQLLVISLLTTFRHMFMVPAASCQLLLLASKIELLSNDLYSWMYSNRHRRQSWGVGGRARRFWTGGSWGSQGGSWGRGRVVKYYYILSCRPTGSVFESGDF